LLNRSINFSLSQNYKIIIILVIKSIENMYTNDVLQDKWSIL